MLLARRLPLRAALLVRDNSRAQKSIASASRLQCTLASTHETDTTVAFVTHGVETRVRAPLGETLLDLAKANNIELEGACDGECACSTCHVILERKAYDALEPPTEDELDMLDMAFEVQDTSRLGCQIRMTRDLADSRFEVPEADWGSTPQKRAEESNERVLSARF